MSWEPWEVLSKGGQDLRHKGSRDTGDHGGRTRWGPWSDEGVERVWKPKEHSTNVFSNGTGIGVREPGSCPPPTPEAPSSLGPTSAMTVAQADISG